MKLTVIPIVIGALGTVTNRLAQVMEDLEMRTCGDRPNYSCVKTSQNTKKNPGVLRRLAVTQTSVENQQLTLV